MITNHETIARRADEIWLERGCPEGQDNQIWQVAEQEAQRLGLWAWVLLHVFEVTPEANRTGSK